MRNISVASDGRFSCLKSIPCIMPRGDQGIAYRSWIQENGDLDLENGDLQRERKKKSNEKRGSKNVISRVTRGS